MPTYHLPNGKIIHSDNPLSAEDLDSLVGDDNKAQPGETGIKWVNDLIRPRLQQLVGQEEGPLNPDPNKNPLVAGSQLPETEQSPGILGAVRHGLYENIVRPLASPLGILGTFEGSDIPKEPIGMGTFDSVAKDIELPKSIEAVPKVAEKQLEIPKQLGPAKDIQLPESKLSEQGYYNPKPPAEQLHPNRLEPSSEIIPGQSTLNEAEASAHPPELQDAIPPPGSARTGDAPSYAPFKDIRPIQWGGSADQVLDSREITKPIVQTLRENGWDKAKIYEGTKIRELGKITDGLNNDQLEAFGRTIENKGTPEDEQLLSSIPDLDKKLTDVRAFYDNVFKDLKVQRSDLGYQQDYFTHIEKLPKDQQSILGSIFNFQQKKDAIKSMFGRPPLVGGEGTGEARGIYDQGVGSIGDSPFTKTRTGGMQDIDYNVNKVGRAYIESAARDMYIRPAVEKATEMVKDLPDSKLKEMSEALIKNVTNFTSTPELNRAYKDWTRTIIDTTSKSMLGFNPHLQALHAMRLGPVYTELGTRDFANGVGAILKNPAAAYQETASLGMLPSELYPFKFQNADERMSSILNFKSYVDFLDRSIAYNGFKSKYARMGMAPEDAATKALTDTKRVTFMTDPVRANLLLNPEYKNVVGRLVNQYKQVPAKVLEWIVQTGANAKENPAAFRRAATLLGGAGALKMAGGPSIFHAPTSLLDWSAASISEMGKIFTYAGKGQFDKAAEEFALWNIPGGLSAKRLLTSK